jgi:hypothetical protein
MIGCSRTMVSRMIAQMAQSGLLGRRGKQYVVLKNWNYIDNGSRRKQPPSRLEAVYSARSLDLTTGRALQKWFRQSRCCVRRARSRPSNQKRALCLPRTGWNDGWNDHLQIATK